MTSTRRVAPPRDLTIPEPGSTTARRLLSLSLGHLAEALGAVIGAAPAAQRAEAAELARLVRSARTAGPGSLLSALRRPEIGTLVRCLHGGRGSAGERAAWLGELRARLAGEIPEGEAMEIEGGIALALTDNNPLSMVEAHPEKAGNAVDLGGKSGEAWCSALRDALAVIAEHLPDLRGEMDLYVHRIVPVGWHATRHLSATYQEAIGTLYLSLHPSRMTLAEALIHEHSHTKLNTLLELDPVLENARDELHASPVRPDPRPLHGVLLAVHAFLPVTRLYEAMIERGHELANAGDLLRRFAEVRALNREGAEVLLREARPTAVGAGLLDEIRRWDAHYRSLA